MHHRIPGDSPVEHTYFVNAAHHAPPAGCEIVADDVMGDGDGVVRFRAHGMFAEVSFEIVLCKGTEMDADVAGFIVDANQ